MVRESCANFSLLVNGKAYKVSDVDPTLSLNLWLRQEACLTGTKWMCNEGGCGSCVVLLQYPGHKPKAVNSCLVLLGSVNGCHVTTVEGVGSSQSGFSEIQSNMVKHNAIQCGYCTPGFVMSMQGLLQEKESPTQQMIENAFDGNICRCTGYRPILDAMKCFGCDKNPSSGDIEDLVSKNSQPNKAIPAATSFQYLHSNTKWMRFVTLLELQNALKAIDGDYKLVCGNTGSGIYKSTDIHPLYIDINQVAEFQAITDNTDSVEFGASVTLSRLADYLSHNSAQSVTFEPIASHILKIAGTPVRNAASWAGNVALKNQHHDFPSDLCTLLQAGNATIKVYDVTSDSYSSHAVYGDNGIIHLNMDKKIIVSMSLPKIRDADTTVMKSYKIMPRSQNSYAYVNAGMRATLNEDRSTFNQITLVFGAVSNSFHQATNTENYLKGKQINCSETLKGALNELTQEAASSCANEYRLNLILGLFYKFYLSLCDPKQLGSGIASGMESLIRPISSGTQTFATDSSIYPVSKYVPKISGIHLATGEAEFISDSIPSRSDLYCDVVLSRVGNAEIDVIDSSEAEKLPGFVQIITKDNFPSDVNNAWGLNIMGSTYPELTILSAGKIKHSGEVVAVVIAESLQSARRIAAAVKVTYKNVEKPLITCRDAIEANSMFENSHQDIRMGDVDKAMAEAKHVISGEIEFGHQYHFYMETIVCKAQHTEDRGFNILASTQEQTTLQTIIAQAFNVPANKIEISTKRIGGTYGAKATNGHLPTCIAALAAHVTNRPVYFHTSLETCMKMLGTRCPYTIQYKIGFNDDGEINGSDLTVYGNSGCSNIDDEILFGLPQLFGDSAYFCPNRHFKTYLLKTNVASTTFCRAPGSMQMTATADLIVEHVASYLKKSPVDVKFANIYKKGQLDIKKVDINFDFRQIYQKLLTKYNIRERMEGVEAFNQANRWKKKGIAVTPMKFGIHSEWARHGVLISIYAFDGTVVVSHGGIDCGQGINIKVAQVVAHKLGIPLDIITVQRTNTITSANSSLTAGSITTETVCRSVIPCCEVLNSRIDVVRKEKGAGLAWPQLIQLCFQSGVDLSASYMSPISTDQYHSFGVTAAEVEYDVITGQRQILQVDLVFDCGTSLNPAVDIGQVEGAFMMGVGFWLSEKMVYDQTTGQLLTDGTWEYKPPVSQDIPIKWNIELLEGHPNDIGVLRSKASGEPPLCMAVCVGLALKRAVEAARKDKDNCDYFALPIPATVDALHNCISINPLEDFTLN